MATADNLIDQDLRIRLVPEEHLLEGRVVMTPADESTGLPDEFRLADRAEINSVMADGRQIAFTFTNGLLHISPEHGVVNLAISYRVRFDDPVPRTSVGIEDPSFGITATIMPQGSFLSAASGWHPLPLGRQSRFRVTVVGPLGLYAVTAGRLLNLESSQSRSTTTWQTVFPQSSLALAAGYYQVRQDLLGEIQLLVFTSEENASLATGYLESCREYLRLYQKLFGPYPYAKFAVVENFYPSGYGLPGWTLLGSSVIRLPFIRTTSLPHEIAHAWWGNAIGVDYQTGNWCEGLATYVADYYLKELDQPAEALEYRRRILRDYASLVEAGDDLPLTAFRSRTTKRNQAVGYGKAAMVFHLLRKLIGDEAFWAGLQSAARDGLGRSYAWKDLQEHFEAVSNLDLATFFHQWTEWPGAPRLQLAGVEIVPDPAGWQVSGRVIQAEPFYSLNVPLRLVTATRVQEQTLSLTGRQVQFVFTTSERPSALTVDPESDVFRRLYPEELPATVNSLRGSRVPLVVVARGAEESLDAARDLLLGLQWHEAQVMSELDYLAQRPVGRDLLVLGWPASSELRPSLPAGFAAAAHQFTVRDKLYSAPDDVLFMVTAGQEEGRVIGYFLSGSIAAARDTAHRIPHYGRYSYLVFSDGRNQVKATWDTLQSPLKVHFGKDIVP